MALIAGDFARLVDGLALRFDKRALAGDVERSEVHVFAQFDDGKKLKCCHLALMSVKIARNGNGKKSESGNFAIKKPKKRRKRQDEK